MKVIIKLDNRVIEQYDGYKATTTRDVVNDELTVNIESYIDYIDDEQINFDKLDSLKNSDFDIKF